MIELGISADIHADWELGIFTDNFGGDCFSLPDGQTLAVYLVAECDGYTCCGEAYTFGGDPRDLL